MSARTTVTVTHSVGLHARPSVKLTKLAKAYPCAIAIAASESGPWIDAKSIVKVMAMKVPEGALLHIKADGERDSEAVQALRGLVERDFDEGEADARTA
jgi:phosphocarrier protein